MTHWVDNLNNYAVVRLSLPAHNLTCTVDIAIVSNFSIPGGGIWGICDDHHTFMFKLHHDDDADLIELMQMQEGGEEDNTNDCADFFRDYPEPFLRVVAMDLWGLGNGEEPIHIETLSDFGASA